MRARVFVLCLAALLGACAHDGTWFFADSGYSIIHADDGQLAFKVHVNQLKQLGGDINSAEFRRFVFERLTWYEGCKGGWEMLPCVADGSCIQQGWRSVTVFARCAKA